jgi:D-arabinose 1-dehydrogenase-like Zn-dependent alcohol dehydrogenase
MSTPADLHTPEMSATMRGVVLDAPGPPDALQIRELPIPEPRPGWVLIEVKAFGLNRSELHTRLGLSEGVTFPRVLGIEAVGVVAAAPDGEFEKGQQVATMLGGMGRTFDGGYAEYTSVPAAQVIPFRSDLDWATLGAIPEMLLTANGSLTVGLDVQAGQTLLIRGGTSSVGMATAVLAKERGLTVLSSPDPTASTSCARSASTTRSSTTARSPRRSARSFQTASTRRSSWWVQTPSTTRSARPGSTASPASPGCSATSGRSETSIRSTSFRTESG